MHGQWDRAQKAGVALVESFFAGDPVTGRKVGSGLNHFGNSPTLLGNQCRPRLCRSLAMATCCTRCGKDVENPDGLISEQEWGILAYSRSQRWGVDIKWVRYDKRGRVSLYPYDSDMKA
ncbi:hypothetical protein V8E53_005054 [Lactarius tabidus]